MEKQMVYFRIKTADGREYVGSVQGFGGQLGGGAAHCGPEREQEVALRELQDCIARINETGRWGARVLEAREAPGHCIVKSVMDWKVPHDGAFNRQFVPLAGATATVLDDTEVRTIQPGTCRVDLPDEKAIEAARLIADRTAALDVEWAKRVVANEDYLPWADVHRAKEILGMPTDGMTAEQKAAYARIASREGAQRAPAGS